jgi:succinylglutamic semialdehyde dehydrogenase
MSMVIIQQYINGQWRAGAGEVFYSYNPANSERIAEVAAADEVQVRQAALAAREAFPAWSRLTMMQRLPYLNRFRDRVLAEKTALAALISAENGKPLWEAETEVAAMLNKLSISLQAYQERSPSRVSRTVDKSAVLRHGAHGVVAILGPFNFPCHLPQGHIIPALLAGNTIVFKPSELTPATAAFVLRLWHEAGLPPGVINGVFGEAAVGRALLKENINGVFFTGSYATGKAIHQQFAGRPEVILALEMGGNNPYVIWGIKNIPAGVAHTLQSAFISAGQRCTCARRLIVPDNHEGMLFIKALTLAAARLRVGEAMSQPAPFMGPVISAKAATAVLDYQQLLQEQGGHVLVAAKSLIPNTGLVSPAIIDVTAIADRDDNELFGPLLQVIRVNDFQGALLEANNTAYGLAAGILTDSAANYHEFLNTVRAGLINWNRPLTGASSHAPFGGLGHSGNHRPSAYYAADYCAYPIASLEAPELIQDKKLPPGLAVALE